MLTVAQKKAVYQAVLKNYTIETKAFTAQTIYSNQPLTSYPVIILNYPQEEDREQNTIGNYIGTPGSEGQRSLAWLSINIEAKDAQGLNANVISKDIARQLSQHIRHNWKMLDSGNIKFRRKSPTKDLTAVNQAAGIFDTARQEMDIFLAYNISW
uniref:Uncharacterized protein n=1 Tax=viral metagenome TaxID=1070528 RepID=A0A6M3M1R4_9ZZZZ